MTRIATPAQVNFLRKLAGTALGADAPAYIADLTARGVLNDIGATSREIDALKVKADAARVAGRAKVEAELALGMYRDADSGTIFRVVKSRESGRLYAKRLTVLNANSASFSYDGGAIYRIKPEWRMSLDEAKAWGRQYGICCVCAADLTDPKSVAAGIGPVCAKRV